MTSVLVEAVRELADALEQPCEIEPVDTGIPAGMAYVLPGESACPHLTKSTVVCWVARLGVDRHEFKDHVAAMLYLRVLGVRDET